ncbi:sensor histidine kinase [Lysinibacillus sp. NPDC097287]|uniref:sensor histidine kinase n=1 Tax=Lysinibacillus sp. NPDC097287 TaxID=3364144 RepID=UPI00380A526D
MEQTKEEKHKLERMCEKHCDARSLTEEDYHRMFDRFYTADQSRLSKSTELGLSIVKTLMEKMNGTIIGQLKKLSIVCGWKTVEELNS